MKILYVCGGTGGHIYPAVALAEDMQSRNHEIVFLGRSGSMEERIVKPLFDFKEIEAYPLVRGRLKSNLTLPFKFLRSILGAYRQIKKENPQFVMGTGGYVSLPVLIGGFLAGKTVYVQEQNAVAGIANKIGSWFAKRIYVASEQAMKEFPKGNSRNLGNPVRSLKSQDELSEPKAYQEYSQVIMVVGGSQGAQGVNRKVKDLIPHLPKDTLLYWQVGRRNFETYSKEYQAHPQVVVVDYIDDIYSHMSYADVLISRAGASTIAEILCMSKASVLVPFPYATANHQEANARVLEKAGAAFVELESEKNELSIKVNMILKDSHLKAKMENSAKELAMPEAAININNNILELEEVEQ